MHFSRPTQDHVDTHPEGLQRHPELAIPGHLPDDQWNSTCQREKLSRSYTPRKPYIDPQIGSATRANGHTQTGHERRRTPSLHSLPESTSDKDKGYTLATENSTIASDGAVGRKASVRTTRSAATIATGAFANGAALTGPNSEPGIDESIYERGVSAERTLSKKDKDRIFKGEKKESRRLSKLIKLEASTEQTALNSALSTLASLQDLHKAAVKREAKAQSTHAKALGTAQKAESRFHESKAHAAEERARADARVLEQRARLQGKLAEMRAQEERVESERQIINDLEERVAECAREVERLRIVKGTDERERRAKMMELRGNATAN